MTSTSTYNTQILKNKVAIITGASSGIGHASALLFAQQGAKVILGARRKEKLEELADRIHSSGGQAVVLAGDVKDSEYHSSLVNSAVKNFGGLDIAFNNAGIMGDLANITDLPLDSWQNTINTNLTSAFFAARHQIPAMQKRGGGSIIFTSSFVGYTAGFPQVSAYAASKAGLIGLTQALATEWGQERIRVNALLPGGTDTPMSREFADTPEALDFVKSLYAFKRIATPEEIAQSALYLASDMSNFTTGTALLCDGGVSINRV